MRWAATGSILNIFPFIMQMWLLNIHSHISLPNKHFLDLSAHLIVWPRKKNANQSLSKPEVSFDDLVWSDDLVQNPV